MQFQKRSTFRAAPERVFACIDDPQERLKWMGHLVAIRFPDGGARRAGSKIEMDIREGKNVSTYRGQILALDPPRRWTVRLVGRLFTMEVDYLLTPVPEGTQVTFRNAVTCHSLIARVMMPIGMIVVPMTIRKQMRALQALVES